MNRIKLTNEQLNFIIEDYKKLINPALEDQLVDYIQSINNTHLRNIVLWGEHLIPIRSSIYLNSAITRLSPEEIITDYRSSVISTVFRFTKQLQNNEQLDFLNSPLLDEYYIEDVLRGLAFFSEKGLDYCKTTAKNCLPEDLIANLPKIEQMHKNITETEIK